jgi:hypothetical protein
LNECFRRVIAKKLTLNCSWKEGDDSTMQDDPQTGLLKGLLARVSKKKKPASKDRLFIARKGLA